jgi:peroxiredoxin
MALLTMVMLSGVAVHYYIKWTGPYYLPEITLETLDGKPFSLTELRGKPVLTVFWASTCATCLEELPALLRFYDDYAARGLEIVGIVIYYDNLDSARALVKNRKIPYRILLDRAKKATHAFRNVHYTPTTFLADPDGRIIYRQQGRTDFDLLREKIQEFTGG